MHRCLHRIGLSLLITTGVIAWNQQQSQSFSQEVPLFFSIAQDSGTTALDNDTNPDAGISTAVSQLQPNSPTSLWFSYWLSGVQ